MKVLGTTGLTSFIPFKKINLTFPCILSTFDRLMGRSNDSFWIAVARTKYILQKHGQISWHQSLIWHSQKIL